MPETDWDNLIRSKMPTAAPTDLLEPPRLPQGPAAIQGEPADDWDSLIASKTAAPLVHEDATPAPRADELNPGANWAKVTDAERAQAKLPAEPLWSTFARAFAHGRAEHPVTGLVATALAIPQGLLQWAGVSPKTTGTMGADFFRAEQSEMDRIDSERLDKYDPSKGEDFAHKFAYSAGRAPLEGLKILASGGLLGVGKAVAKRVIAKAVVDKVMGKAATSAAAAVPVAAPAVVRQAVNDQDSGMPMNEVVGRAFIHGLSEILSEAVPIGGHVGLGGVGADLFKGGARQTLRQAAINAAKEMPAELIQEAIAQPPETMVDWWAKHKPPKGYGDAAWQVANDTIEAALTAIPQSVILGGAQVAGGVAEQKANRLPIEPLPSAEEGQPTDMPAEMGPPPGGPVAATPYDPRLIPEDIRPENETPTTREALAAGIDASLAQKVVSMGGMPEMGPGGRISASDIYGPRPEGPAAEQPTPNIAKQDEDEAYGRVPPEFRAQPISPQNGLTLEAAIASGKVRPGHADAIEAAMTQRQAELADAEKPTDRIEKPAAPVEPTKHPAKTSLTIIRNAVRTVFPDGDDAQRAMTAAQEMAKTDPESVWVLSRKLVKRKREILAERKRQKGAVPATEGAPEAERLGAPVRPTEAPAPVAAAPMPAPEALPAPVVAPSPPPTSPSAAPQGQVPAGAGARPAATPQGMARVRAAQKAMRSILKNPDIVGEDRSTSLENAKQLIQFLQAKAHLDELPDTGRFNGDRIAYTGVTAEDHGKPLREFIYLDGSKAGAYGHLPAVLSNTSPPVVQAPRPTPQIPTTPAP
ncbi:MAG: hypothetical protein MUP86_02765, partial [Dehalococcoidia bacterium]|nr:hypothetical protein [Dehalococcoidia bacterium]